MHPKAGTGARVVLLCLGALVATERSHADLAGAETKSVRGELATEALSGGELIQAAKRGDLEAVEARPSIVCQLLVARFLDRELGLTEADRRPCQH